MAIEALSMLSMILKFFSNRKAYLITIAISLIQAVVGFGLAVYGFINLIGDMNENTEVLVFVNGYISSGVLVTCLFLTVGGYVRLALDLDLFNIFEAAAAFAIPLPGFAIAVLYIIGDIPVTSAACALAACDIANQSFDLYESSLYHSAYKRVISAAEDTQNIDQDCEAGTAKFAEGDKYLSEQSAHALKSCEKRAHDIV
eukprot:CAMPEP_0185836088 /NCGR_PEP_ID=MMETSP1353-20130828/9070_1 /TAXON_ID=1077150 /ORGANISM="Erythrolobus australicus, Strain CCMP3124" /LENGTH=199 /DNA_ID=CAMNT_0028534829 /DNA_START=213 /DNA_END=812 /DNA_ORIENTATION=+